MSGRELNVPYSPFLYQSFHKGSSRNCFHRGIFLLQVNKWSCDRCFCLHYLATFVAWLRPVCLLQIDLVEQKSGLQICSISFWANLGCSDYLHWLDEETGDVWFNVNWLLNLGVYFDYFDSIFGKCGREIELIGRERKLFFIDQRWHLNEGVCWNDSLQSKSFLVLERSSIRKEWHHFRCWK